MAYSYHLAVPLLLLCLADPVHSGADQTTVYGLYSNLFTNYNIDARPVSDSGNTLEVYMTFSLLSLVDVSMSK